MDTFNQTLTQPAAVKEEVSDAAPTLCDHTDDESTTSSPLCGEKREADELDSEVLQANGAGLPPRKRAKTQEEKEQRRIERVMRNRQAAHASREKKRKHLETLEVRCHELETENSQLKGSAQRCQELEERLEQLESVVMLARTSGDLSVLESISSRAAPRTPSWSSEAPLSGGLDMAPKDPAGSPAPSLEDDCASPEALFLHRSDSSSHIPQSPDYLSTLDEDPFDSHFSLESQLFASTDHSANPESSSKSRHPAAVTPPHGRALPLSA